MKTVYLDLDGVIVDFRKGVLQLLGKDTPELLEKHLNTETEPLDALFGGTAEMKEAIQNAGLDFWTDMPLFKNSYTIVQTVEGFCRSKGWRLAFLSSPWTIFSASGKFEWVKRNFPEIPLVLTKDKWVCSSPQCLLIDDYTKNLKDWAGPKLLWDSGWSDRATAEEVIQLLNTVLVEAFENE